MVCQSYIIIGHLGNFFQPQGLLGHQAAGQPPHSNMSEYLSHKGIPGWWWKAQEPAAVVRVFWIGDQSTAMTILRAQF